MSQAVKVAEAKTLILEPNKFNQKIDSIVFSPYIATWTTSPDPTTASSASSCPSRRWLKTTSMSSSLSASSR